MTVDRQYGRIIFCCECGQTFEASSRDFYEAVIAARRCSAGRRAGASARKMKRGG